MPLAGYQPARREIKVGAESFHVRGLGLTDISVLVREHFPDLDAVFDLFQSGFDGMDAEQIQNLAMVVVSQAPGLAANIIATAAGEGDASDAEQLPAPVQIKALVDIGDLTFQDVGGPKKGLELVMALLQKTEVQKVITKARTTG
jgi:hypothetical protein